MRWVLTSLILTISLGPLACKRMKLYADKNDEFKDAALQPDRWNSAHSLLQQVFSRAVIVKEGYSQFNYDLVRSDPGLRSAFDNYTAWLAQEAPASRLVGTSNSIQVQNLKKAFWINTYNACTIKIMLDNRASDTNTINDMQSGNIFSSPVCRVGGGALSLNQIETGILRNANQRGLSGGKDQLPQKLAGNHNFGPNGSLFDTRIHYAVNCASSSCPMLSAQLFTSGNIEQQLATLERGFWTTGREARPQPGQTTPRRQIRPGPNGGVIVNPVFVSWYRDDFPNLQQTISQFLAGSQEAQLLAGGMITDKGANGQTDYDWRPNSGQEQGNAQFTYREIIPPELASGSFPDQTGAGNATANETGDNRAPPNSGNAGGSGTSL